jgi:hypothetical protein
MKGMMLMFTKNQKFQRGFEFMESNHSLIHGIEDFFEEKTMKEMFMVINETMNYIKDYVPEEFKENPDFIYGIKVYIEINIMNFLEKQCK